MQEIIQVFRMSELSIETRIKIIKQLGIAINNQLGMNCTEALVYELVLALNPSNGIKNDESYTRYIEESSRSPDCSTPTDEQVLKAVYESGLHQLAPDVLRTEWKDGIDIDVPSPSLMNFVRKLLA